MGMITQNRRSNVLNPAAPLHPALKEFPVHIVGSLPHTSSPPRSRNLFRSAFLLLLIAPAAALCAESENRWYRPRHLTPNQFYPYAVRILSVQPLYPESGSYQEVDANIIPLANDTGHLWTLGGGYMHQSNALSSLSPSPSFAGFYASTFASGHRGSFFGLGYLLSGFFFDRFSSSLSHSAMYLAMSGAGYEWSRNLKTGAALIYSRNAEEGHLWILPFFSYSIGKSAASFDPAQGLDIRFLFTGRFQGYLYFKHLETAYFIKSKNDISSHQKGLIGSGAVYNLLGLLNLDASLAFSPYSSSGLLKHPIRAESGSGSLYIMFGISLIIE